MNIPSNIEQVESDILKLFGENSFIRFDVQGGQDTSTPWSAAGVFIEPPLNGKLVFEMLHLEATAECYVRVYLENTSEILFSSELSKNNMAVSEALVIFKDNANKMGLSDLTQLKNEILETKIEFGTEMCIAFYPITPPLSSK